MLEERGIEHAAGSQAWLRQDARGDRVAGASPARRHRRLVPRRRRRARAHPARGVVVRLRRRAGRVRAGARPALRARAGRRDRGGDRARQPGADRADGGLAGRHRPARPPVRAPRRRQRRAAVGLVQLLLVPLLPRAYARRAHPRRARARPLAAAARLQRRGPAGHAGARRPRRVRARARPAARRRGVARPRLAGRQRDSLDPAEVVAAAIEQVRDADRRGARCASIAADASGRVRGGAEPVLAGAEVRVPLALGARLFGVLTATAATTGSPPAASPGWPRSPRSPRRRSPTRTPTTASAAWRAR